jgi:hypothetical protein
MVPVVVYPQRTSNSADDATGYAADNTTYDPADRAEHPTSDMAPLVRPFPRTLSNALSLSRERRGKKGHDTGHHHNAHFPVHGLISWFWFDLTYLTLMPSGHRLRLEMSQFHVRYPTQLTFINVLSQSLAHIFNCKLCQLE